MSVHRVESFLCVRISPPNRVEVVRVARQELDDSDDVDPSDASEAILANHSDVVALYKLPHQWARDDPISYPPNRIWKNSGLVGAHHESIHAVVYLVARRGVNEDFDSLTDAEIQACKRRLG
jgi:hypothetical protein